MWSEPKIKTSDEINLHSYDIFIHKFEHIQHNPVQQTFTCPK